MKKKVALIVFLIVSLGVIRFLDFFVLWSLMSFEFENEFSNSLKTHGEIKEQKMIGDSSQWTDCSIPNFVHLGLTNFLHAKQALMEQVAKNKSPISVVSYFDLLHPMIFLMYNKSEKIEVPDHFLMEIKNGLTELYISKSDKAKIVNNGVVREETVAVFGETTSWMKTETVSNDNSIRTRWSPTYIWQTRGFSIFLSFFYFYIPLIFIFLFAFMKNHSIFSSFLYFIEMTVFFDVGTVFVKSQYLLTFRVPRLLIVFLMLLIGVGFIYGVISLVRSIKKGKLDFTTFMIILGFILLPFFLKF